MPSRANVDAREIDKFDRVAQLWWDPSGKMGMLHVINPLRAQFVSDHATVRGARVADIGCGGGIFAEWLAKAGGRVVGIDQSEPTLAVARRHAAAGLAIDYRWQTVDELVAADAHRYDIVTCMEMLEHVPSPGAIVHACVQLLRPGGHAFFSTINRTFKAWLFAIIGGEYVLRILPHGTHQYAKLVRPGELRTWAAFDGLEFRARASLMFNPWTRRFRVVPDREDVNYMACFRKPS